MARAIKRMARLVAVREQQRARAALGAAEAARSLAAARAQCATVAMLARSMRPDMGPALGIDLAARLRFGERMDAAQAALLGAAEAAEAREARAQAGLLDASRRRDIAERLRERADRAGRVSADRKLLERVAGDARGVRKPAR